jgi:hypothetical protein
MPEQFDQAGKASISTIFADRDLKITYSNPEKLKYQYYEIKSVLLDNEEIEFKLSKELVSIERELLSSLNESETIELTVKLG